MSKYVVMVKSNDPDYMFFEDGIKAKTIGHYNTLAGANRAAKFFIDNMDLAENFNVKIYLNGINDKIEYDAEQNSWYRFKNLVQN
jgi:hypothetical protein